MEYTCMRWSEAEEKDLKPGLILYHKFGIHLYMALLNEDNTYSPKVVEAKEEKEIWEHYKAGGSLSEPTAINMFPILKLLGYKYLQSQG